MDGFLGRIRTIHEKHEAHEIPRSVLKFDFWGKADLFTETTNVTRSVTKDAEDFVMLMLQCRPNEVTPCQVLLSAV